jgi:hypothetical protein
MAVSKRRKQNSKIPSRYERSEVGKAHIRGNVRIRIYGPTSSAVRKPRFARVRMLLYHAKEARMAHITHAIALMAFSFVATYIVQETFLKTKNKICQSSSFMTGHGRTFNMKVKVYIRKVGRPSIYKISTRSCDTVWNEHAMALIEETTSKTQEKQTQPLLSGVGCFR